MMHPEGSPKPFPRLKAAIAWLLLLVLLAVCISGLLKPLMDYDFFWHLKSGEWIWQHKALVSGEDPFCYTAPSSLSAPQRFTLNSYWLSQIILYLVERSVGLGGIVALNIVLFSVFLGIMWWRREGEALTYLSLMVLMAVVLVMFPFERPQIYSFIGLALLLKLLDGIRSSVRAGTVPAREFGACALLMLLWANLHPAFVVGCAALGLFGAEALARRTLGGAGDAERRLFPLLAGALAAVALIALVNPNGWQVFWRLNLPTMLTDNVLEYESSVNWYSKLGARQMLAYWLLLAATALAVVRRPRCAHLPEAALLLVMSYLSFVHIRFVPFFLVLALPVAGRGLAGERFGAWSRAAAIVAALIGGTATMLAWQPQLKPLLERRWVHDYNLPVDATSFVLAEDLQGRMYNHFSWGGYLSWKLGPERKVFIDGRVGDERPARVQAAELDAGRSDSVGGRSYWNSVFDRWGVSWVITPVFDVAGNLTPLPLNLLSDTEWVPVFLGGNAVVFVRRFMGNDRTIQRRAVRRSDLLTYFLWMVDQTLAAVPRNAPLLIARGDLLLKLGRTPEAREAYSRAVQAAPENPAPRERLRTVPQ